MRVVIDITQLYNWDGRLTGIPRVMYELSSRFAAINHFNSEYIVWNEDRKGFDTITYEMYTAHQSLKNNLRTKGRLSWHAKAAFQKSPVLLRRAIRKAKRTVLASSDTTLNPFEFQNKDKLLVVWGEWDSQYYRKALINAIQVSEVSLYQVAHDMLPLITPQYSSHSTEGLRSYVKEIYPICASIISVSENTKRDVIAWMHDMSLPCPPVKVIRLGENFDSVTSRQPSDAFFELNSKFILCVGTIEARKNHLLLYYTYKLALSRGKSLPTLVIAGRRGWLTDNVYDLMTSDPETKEYFIFLHHADDNELSWLYQHCMFTIYPSHYEGWGLPVAESMYYQTPCIASQASSIPEIAGDLVSYFDPSSSEECLRTMLKYSDPSFLESQRKKLKAYKNTTWDQTFDRVKQIMEIH